MTTILIVDDDPLQASLMMSLLGRQFGNVCRVTDAAEALCLIEQPEFAGKLGLVISGHHTPGIGGRPLWPNCARGCLICRCSFWARMSAAPSDYSRTSVSSSFPGRLAAEKMLAVTGQMLAEHKKRSRKRQTQSMHEQRQAFLV